MPVYAWERVVQAALARTACRPVRWLNIALAGEETMTLALPWMLGAMVWFTDVWLVLVLAAMVSSPQVEAWIKARVSRGRPRSPIEPGLPSGDCMAVTIWAFPLLGWWGWLPVLFVMYARMAQGAHWPLDTVAGVGLGLLLVLPALVL